MDEYAGPRSGRVLAVEADLRDEGHDAGHAHEGVVPRRRPAVHEVGAGERRVLDRRDGVDLLRRRRRERRWRRRTTWDLYAVGVVPRLAVAPVAPVFGAVEIDQLAIVAVNACITGAVAQEHRGRPVPVAVADQRLVVAEPAPRVAAAGMRAVVGAKLLRAEEGGLPFHEAPALIECVGTGGAGASNERQQQPH